MTRGRPWAMWSVDEWSNEDTKDSVQVCSILHVADVVVRRVTLVIVHNGLNESVVVVDFCVAISVRELLYREMLYLHLPSVIVDCCQLLPIKSR